MGDYITIGGVMFEVIDDATSDGTGQVVINVNKPIRKAIAAGAAVEYKAPYAEMRRTSDTHSLTLRPLVANGALEFREAF
ncbi:hypothetical protein D3C81_2176120 [compost metagenome]